MRLVTKYASHGNVRKRERVREDGPAVRFSTGIPASISYGQVSRGTFDYYAATEEEGGGSRFSPLDGSIIMDSLLRFQTWSKQ